MIVEENQIRKPGGGRNVTSIKPGILEDFKIIMEETTPGDPMSPLLWTCKSANKTADELCSRGHEVSVNK